MDTSLRLKNVSKSFGKFDAVKSVDLEIFQGEFLTLLGPSGSGKSTLLMMLAGFLDVSQGDITIAGRSITKVPAERRNFGMVFQGYALFPHMSVRQNIAYSLEIRKHPRKDIENRVDEMLALVQLEQFAERKPDQLSGGQKQRVALARALAFSPPVLLLDEPLGALDKRLRVDVQEQLKDIHRKFGTTFIFVTHDQEEALSMSDRIAIMREGIIEQVGTPNELYERPKTAFAAGFLGNSNFLECGDKLYALRPEKIDILPIKLGGTKTCVSGVIRSSTYLGSQLRILVELADGAVIEADLDPWRSKFEFSEGQDVDLTWSREALVELQDQPASLPADRRSSIKIDQVPDAHPYQRGTDDRENSDARNVI